MITNAVTLEQGVTVTQLKGQIYLVAADGSRKLLAEGDVLPKGAVIMSPNGASFMGGGQSFNVQPASEQSEPVEEGDAPQLAQNGAAGTPDDISALQQAILGGADPTQAFEASAAGGAPAAGGGGIGGVAGASGNGGFVTIDRTGSATIAEATFDTTYNTNGEPPLGAAGEDEVFDLTPPTISVVAPDNTNDTTPTLTGTTDAPVGSTVTLLVTDANGNQQTLTAIVTPTGTFTVDVVTPLAEGSYTVTASVTDPAGNTGTATDNGSVDSTAPSAPQVEILDGADNVISANERETGVGVIIRLPGDAKVGDRLDVDWNGDGVPDSSKILTADDIGRTQVTLTIPTTDLPVNGPITVDATLTDPVGNTSPKGSDNSVVNAAPQPVDDQFTVEEDGTISINVLGNDTDADGDRLTITAINGQAIAEGGTVAISNGSLTLANGQLIFTPAPDFNGDISFEYTITDGVNSSTGGVTGTVTPVNDAAIIAGDDIGAVTEDASPDVLTDTGVLTVTDVDGADEVAFKTDAASIKASEGALGSLTITEGGVWTYNVDNSKVEYLGEGETKVETFVVKSVDGTEHTVTITITGTNDKAIISGDAVGEVTEGNGNIVLSDSGTLMAVDVDGKDADNTFRTDVAAVAHPTEGAPLGSLTITEGGVWTYNVDNSKVEYLGEGETKVETFVVKSVDGTEHTVTITITGTNDKAIISGDAVGEVTEGNGNIVLSDSGTLTAVDVDGKDADNTFRTDVAAVAHPTEGAPLGSLTITEGGVWTYNVDNSKVEYLGEGETKVETFVVKSVDGTEHTVTITITGTNDKAIISGDAVGEVTEGNGNIVLSDSGTLTAVDVDGKDADNTFRTDVAAVAHPTEGAPLGSLTITEGGVWTYNVDNSKVEYLGEGETKVETFVVKSVDGTEHTVTITITGTNDKAIISGDAVGEVTEGNGNIVLSDSGTLTAVDVDGKDADNTFRTDVAAVAHPTEGAPLGSLTITEGGVWTYNVDNSKVEYLGEGETKVETFVVKSVDGTEHTVTITITGTNDKAIISGDAVGEVTEGNGNIVLSDSGTLTAVDVDGKDADNTFRTDVAAVAHPTEGAPLGSLTITEGGVWTYNVDNSKVEYLGEGETKVETFVVKSVDGTEHTVTITITGTNDKAIISGDAVGEVTEGNGNIVLSDSGTLTAVDVDGKDADNTFRTDVAAVAHPTEGAPLGSLTITEGGVWTYNVDNSKVEYLGEGETKVETFVVKSVDGTEHTVTITITGTNDKAIISGDAVGEVTEGNGNIVLSDSGTLTAVDVDGKDADNTFRTDVAAVAHPTEGPRWAA
ncbi:retention module-containing protein [Aeromonas veronii]|uniref:retention module-containing protein n=1 Tax=Aeromonas veronii TaxID=654 RepID=UPI003F7C7070